MKKLFGLLFILITIMACGTDNKQAVRALETNGFSNITITDSGVSLQLGMVVIVPMVIGMMLLQPMQQVKLYQ